MVEFIEEWFIEQTLGEGAFGEVKLLVNHRTKDEVALKIINLKDHPDAHEVVRKEVQIHKMLNHENIVKFFGSRNDKTVEYLFLEYVCGGELYDQIEPDIGVPTPKAQKYFHEIISGINYLHSLGISHRDIKPENILLDRLGVAKISDFGFATVFRTRGVERLLEKRCGTLPYVAPEVLVKQYKAAPADIWSCGIVLLALLAGELPWDRPCSDCEPYVTWKAGRFMGHPWSKLDVSALNFMKRILCPQASKRITIDQILVHPWMNKRPGACSGQRGTSGSPMKKKMASGLNLITPLEDSISRLCYSQPEPRCFGGDQPEEVEDDPGAGEEKAGFGFSFSQPAGAADMFFLGSQLATTPNNNSPPIQRWVKRMTRFCVTTTLDKTVKELTLVLDDLGYQWKVQTKPVISITISTVDRRKMQLVFKASVLEMGNDVVLLDFRLSRGDGLEFKRKFVKLKEMLHSIEMKGPMSWLTYASNAIPA